MAKSGRAATAQSMASAAFLYRASAPRLLLAMSATSYAIIPFQYRSAANSTRASDEFGSSLHSVGTGGLAPAYRIRPVTVSPEGSRFTQVFKAEMNETMR